MAVFQFWAIKHRPSGHYLPQSDRTSGGFTHFEPQDPCVRPPRLFQKERSAMQALRWWLMGVTTVRHTGGGAWDDYSETWDTHPEPDRKAEDMEIVLVELHV
jgi:hypothetical protein